MKNLMVLMFVVLLSLAISLPVTEANQRRSSGSLRGASVSISHLKLKGTLFTRSLKPLAMIEDTKTKRLVIYEIGDIIEEGAFKIIHITRGEVGLRTGEDEYILSFPKGAVWQEKAPAKSDRNWYNVTREGDVFVVDKGTVSGAINRVRYIMQNVRIRPHFIDGKGSGVKITRLTREGILKEIGIKEGDIIKNVNGLGLNSPYQIFNAYRKLKDKEDLKVDIIRENKPLILTYRIK